MDLERRNSKPKGSLITGATLFSGATLFPVATLFSGATLMSGALLALGLTSSLGSMPAAAHHKGAGRAPGPTAENALEAEQEIARAMSTNDGVGIERLLADDWAVITTKGEVGEGKTIFPSGIKSGYLIRKTFEISEPRVRLYGNVAVITALVKTSGVIHGKPFDIRERQTDVLHWQDDGWKSVLTHESKIESK